MGVHTCIDNYYIVIFPHIIVQVFADLDMCYMLNSDCVDKGEYVDHGTFGEIYHGAVYPSVHATVCIVFIACACPHTYQLHSIHTQQSTV